MGPVGAVPCSVFSSSVFSSVFSSPDGGGVVDAFDPSDGACSVVFVSSSEGACDDSVADGVGTVA